MSRADEESRAHSRPRSGRCMTERDYMNERHVLQGGSIDAYTYYFAASLYVQRISPLPSSLPRRCTIYIFACHSLLTGSSSSVADTDCCVTTPFGRLPGLSHLIVIIRTLIMS